MAEKPKSQLILDEFPGIVTKIDSDNIPPGAALIQMNVAITRSSTLTVRSGYREVHFEDS